MYAIEVNNKKWLLDPLHAKNRIQTFSTEKKALREMKWLKQDHPDINFELFEVEEELYLDMEKGISKQTVTKVKKA